MKKQINPTIKAHLFEGDFTCFCSSPSVPFLSRWRREIDQGGQAKRSHISGQGTAATVQFKAGFEPGSGGARLPPERFPLNFPMTFGHSEPAAYVADSSAHQWRRCRARDPDSATSESSAGSLYVSTICAATASLSATFTDFPTFSSDLADDFIVPGGQTWNVQSIDADGVYFNGTGPATD